MKIKKHIPSYADVIASIVVLSLIAYITIVLLGVNRGTLDDVGLTWFGIYSFLLLMSATKLYGRAVYNAVKRIGAGILGIDQSDNESDSSK